MKIYKITNTLTGKIYVGQTTKSLDARLKMHFYRSTNGDNSYIHRAMKKYGYENFTIELLEECNSRAQLDDREMYWVSKLKSNMHDVGYNISDGGPGKISLQDNKRPHRLGKYACSEETKRKISKANSGKNNGMYGKRFSMTEDHRKKISRSLLNSEIFQSSRKSKEFREKVSNSHSIETYVLNGDFTIFLKCKNSLEVSESLGCTRGHVKNFCRWRKKILKKYWLIYAKNYEKYKTDLERYFNDKSVKIH